jgi:hypothetical protein
MSGQMTKQQYEREQLAALQDDMGRDELPNVIPTSILDQGAFKFYSVSEHGIKFKPGAPQDVWLDVVGRLTAMFESSHRLHVRVMFLLGDALAFGEAAYGEEYAQAIDMTRKVIQLSEKSIKNAEWICASVAPSLRRETLTFSHHEVVAPLDPEEQSEFLDQAESENLTVSALKKLIKERHPTTSRGEERVSSVNLRSVQGLLIACRKAGEWLTENEETMMPAQVREWREALTPICRFCSHYWKPTNDDLD